MKKIFSNAVGILLFVSVFALLISYNCTPNNQSKIILSSSFPDYNINYSGDIDYIQSQFDTDMWKTFIALTWPADNLKPIAKGNILDTRDARSVFENYSFNYDLFLLNANDNTGFSPISWGDSEALNKQRQARWKRWHEYGSTKNGEGKTYCPNLIEEARSHGITNMAEIIPLDEFIQASNDAKPHVPQIDRNKNFVWSAVVFNEVTFDFVNNNKLYTKEGLDSAKHTFQEEVVHQVNGELRDTFLTQKVNSMKDKNGAMHLKTSWKILGDGDDSTKFHTAWAALLFNNLNFVDKHQFEPQCSLVKVGLVGMHISVKTEDQPAFIWATFEHVDNCPEAGELENKHYNFYDENSVTHINKVPTANDTLINTDTTNFDVKAPYWFNPNGQSIDPSQIVREVPIPAETKTLNKTYQKALKNSVWANYQLVGTQWKDPETDKIYPKLLSNTTLETFDQLGSSCFGCHHQVTANTLKGGPNNEQFSMSPFPVGNVLNLKMNLTDQYPGIDTAVYSDYMWSLLKWTELGHLTWKQVSVRKKEN